MSNSLKELYNQEYISLLASTLHKVEKEFIPQEFIDSVFDILWIKRELKQRMHHISYCLYQSLPFSYEENISILEKTFFQMNSAYALENMIFQDYVQIYGLDSFKTSMKALENFTQGSSSEFAIRAFIMKYESKTMQIMRAWALSENEHVRRLASEGCRPRLPWAVALEKFKKDPTEVLEILELLKDDNSAYVKKSVANAINDISKEHVQVVKALALRWLKEDSSRYPLLKHGCRTLLKAGDKDVLALFGFKSIENISLKNFKHTAVVKNGEELFFEFNLLSEEGDLGKLRIEFIIEFVRLRGRFTKKVFKISEGEFFSSQKRVSKKYSFKKISTRKYYKGRHKVYVIVNGETLHEAGFELI